MVPKDDFQQWASLAAYDIETAAAMLSSKRYLYVLFTCQQAAEKMLKALVVKDTGRFPPRIHDLSRLAELASLQLSVDQKRLLAKLVQYYIETRYPEEVSALARDIDEVTAQRILIETKEFLSWLEQKTS